ncbi:MAG: hypothetical protein GY856_14880 [bacterium]|nr:hypothetical protein [bacterium]
MTDPHRAQANVPGHPFKASAGHDYFRAIERTFVDLRGSRLTIVPDDWHLTQRWHEMGMPLEWLERTLHEIFERRRAKGTAHKIVSLRYIRRSIEAAWERRQKLTAPARSGDVPAIDVKARLAALAEALPQELVGAGAWRRRIFELDGDAEAIEQQLAALDHELLEAASAKLDPASRERLDRELATAVATLARRLPAAEIEAAKAQLRERLLRELLYLPVLSLFAPEAAGE